MDLIELNSISSHHKEYLFNFVDTLEVNQEYLVEIYKEIFHAEFEDLIKAASKLEITCITIDDYLKVNCKFYKDKVEFVLNGVYAGLYGKNLGLSRSNYKISFILSTQRRIIFLKVN